MIKATLTTTSGTTRDMKFNTKEHLLEFIELFKSTLHLWLAFTLVGYRALVLNKRVALVLKIK